MVVVPEPQNIQETQNNGKRTISKVRRFLPQVLAGTACNLLLMDLSVVVSFSTVLIGQLHNSTGPLALNEEEASWLGSLQFICQPIGSVISGVMTEILGRQRVMVLLNVPFLLGWILLTAAPSFTVLLVASVIHGFTLGLVEAPICTYVGEVCEPRLRGIMGTYGGIYYQVGSLLVLLLGTLTSWRLTAGICCGIPLFTAVCLFLVPESPIWLVSKGKCLEAQNSLCWLRGWVDPSDVQQEYEELVRQHELTVDSLPENNEVQATDSQSALCKSARGILQRARELLEPATRRPLILITIYMFTVTWSGYVAVRPFMVTVFEKYKMPVGPKWGTVIQAVAGVLGAVCIVSLVHKMGKRPLSLVGQTIAVLSSLLLGVYSFVELRNNHELTATWVPLLMFANLSFLNSCLGMVPWSMLCEVFPFRTRSMSAGICSATYYLFSFAASKSFFDVQHGLELYGAFYLYSGISLAGLVYLYFQLPETEGKSLAAIEQHFAQGKSARED